MLSGIFSKFACSIVFDSCFVYRKSTLGTEGLAFPGLIVLDDSLKLVSFGWM